MTSIRNQTIQTWMAGDEGPGVQPVFLTKEDAIGYAQNRARFRSGEIRILDSNGTAQRTIVFNKANRKM